MYYFRTFANQLQVEVHKLLVVLGFTGELKVGREVNARGDCLFDSFLAQFEDPRIGPTIHPIFRDIKTIQGLLYYILIYYLQKNKLQ